jgi:TRAP-type C4-dicarboxylate transport system permease small subunit
VSAAARAYAALCAWEARLAAALLLAMVALIFLGGVARLLQHPLNWALDIATALFAWACFLCADVAWRRDGLMAMDLVTSRLSPPLQRALRRLNLLLIAGFLGYVVVMGAWLAWTSRARSFQGMPELSYSWVTASMPAGAALLLVTTVLKLRDAWVRPPAATAC